MSTVFCSELLTGARMLSGLLRQVRRLDVYSKPLDDFRVRTFSGGAVSLLTGAIILLLFFSELSSYLTSEVVEELFVDTSTSDDWLKINFEILFPSLPCQFISVDAMDVAGQLQSNITDTVTMDVYYRGESTTSGGETRSSFSTKMADQKALYCGSCHGAETDVIRCCNTCDDVKRAFHLKGWPLKPIEQIEQCQQDYWVRRLHDLAGTGCNVHGWLAVNKVAGNFHIAPGSVVGPQQKGHVHDLYALGPKAFNTSHIISHFSFGDPYPGKTYPLDGQRSVSESGGVMAHYFLKIVPTVYVDANKNRLLTHQFSVTKHQRQIDVNTSSGMPGMFVSYEFSPLMVQLRELEKSFSHFLTKVCAIVGGVFTVASLLDALLYRLARVLTVQQSQYKQK